MKKFVFLALAAVTLFYTHATGQGIVVSSSGQKFDKRLLNHYSEAELEQIKSSDFQKYITIEYYYTQSYIIETVSCTECVPFDPSVFDVSKYEYRRQKSARWEQTFSKYGFKLVLLSTDELIYKTPRQLQQK